MIIHDANIANQFFQEFNERMNEIENQVEPSFNCIDEACVDPMDGTGTFSSLVACEYACIPTAIQDIESSQYTLYPNPNSGNFNLEFYSTNSSTKNFRIIDAQGRTIVNDKLQISEGLNTYRLDYDLNIGFYFLEIDNKKIKIIVQ
jgi:hypothetical protein